MSVIMNQVNVNVNCKYMLDNNDSFFCTEHLLSCDKCDNSFCDSHFIIDYCTRCDKQFCISCSIINYCIGCRDSLCNECNDTRYCYYNCKENYCRRCVDVKECEKCDMGQCEYCESKHPMVYNCDYCDKTYCIECIPYEICENCSEIICKNCCDRCNKKSCRKLYCNWCTGEDAHAHYINEKDNTTCKKCNILQCIVCEIQCKICKVKLCSKCFSTSDYIDNNIDTCNSCKSYLLKKESVLTRKFPPEIIKMMSEFIKN